MARIAIVLEDGKYLKVRGAQTAVWWGCGPLSVDCGPELLILPKFL